jgi:hypothetical protein
MHKSVNPQQRRLFDSFGSILTEKTRKRVYARAKQAALRLIFVFLRLIIAVGSVFMSLKKHFCVPCRQVENFSMFSKAA